MDHLGDDLLEGPGRCPARRFTGAARVPAQRHPLGLPEITGIDLDVARVVEARHLEGELNGVSSVWGEGAARPNISLEPAK